MIIEQISVFIENKKGRLSAIADLLAKNNIDISYRKFSINVSGNRFNNLLPNSGLYIGKLEHNERSYL